MGQPDWTFTDERRTPQRGPQVAVQPLLLGAREAARALAVSARTLWALTKSGEVPHVRVGRRVLYDPQDLRAWVDRLKGRQELTSSG
jgi:excisionase family DNA binding protein